MITKIQTNSTSFHAARVNILATADNHGNIMSLPRLLKTVENNAKDIFPKAGEKSTKNFFTIVGDWFINPSKKGFLTRPELSNGDLQNMALLKTIDSIQNIVNTLGKSSNDGSTSFETLYTMGNHCLDAGTNFILNVLKKNPMKTLITNINLEKSPAIVSIMGNSDKILKSAKYEIPDDKNPDLKHHLLFLGATIPTMDFYNPGLCNGLEFYDNSNQKDANLKETDIEGTIGAIKAEVEAFKNEHPKGVVILLSHLGGRLSEIIRKNIPQINHILNGHDHKTNQSNVGKTSINSLGKDNEMIKALNFEFNDDGDFVKATMVPYFTSSTLSDGLESHPFQRFLNEFFEKDLEPLISLTEVKSEEAVESIKDHLPEMIQSIFKKLGISSPELQESLLKNENFKELIKAEALKALEDKETVEKGISQLSYGNEIRYKNSYLMNFLTSAIKRTIKRNIADDVFTVAIQSSIVRGDLKNRADNLSVMKVFDGVSEDLSNLKIGNIKGEELVGLITENVLANLKAPTRNTLIHWSDIQVNRTLIEAIQTGKSDANYSDAIRVRNKITKEFEPIDLDEEYKMVIGEKFLVKDDIEWPAKIRDRFVSLDKTYDQIFRDFISDVDYKLSITSKVKEQRIL